ncbi:S-adenosyl-L-methionine-dependent methyltransferase [Hyaloscypha variabilis F]|uniref:S-adenosyl-L-methionine-dependent methyltransferase n=1 Tax=Hyaloscypha variabilis (strain UAMH 11265 / GT02V1 / F) TaxID=1149755 RepID=A0A2J6QVR9_HYAVF|nr:S-adenosyl-L-methionine-dependent methyltransferase [Hyaloscypha variabilis F]
MSMRSSVYNHVAENGRTYHRYKEGKYVLPNDETEQNRLDIQHQLFVRTLDGKLHLAPLTGAVHNVLDIATGTGIWAIEFAMKYPTAKVLGTDLSPIQPEFVPPNCHFEVDDAEDDWTYSHSFDYIHGRLLLSCFNQDFPSIIAKSYAALEPGGWFELQDALPLICFDNSWDGSDLQRWTALTLEGAKRLGMDWNKVGMYREWVEAAGFEDVQEFHGAWPSNTWPRDKHHKLLGAWQNQNFMEGVHAISVAVLTRGLGMTPQEVEVLLIGVRRDLCDRNIHCYNPVRVIWGRKPGGTTA